MPKPKKLRSLSVYASTIQRLGRFRITHPVPENQATLATIGFDTGPREGDAVVPAPIGPVSSYNANGREVVRRDLPKVIESRMIWTTWQDWHGQEHSGTQMRSYEVYQREVLPPPEEEVTALRASTGLVLSSRVLDVSLDSEDAIVHVLNLFLELFGGLSIVTPELQSPPSLEVKRLNWRILPPGEYPFARAKQELEELFSHLDEGTRHVIEERVKTITKHKPDFMAVGLGGFRDYVVFGFRTKNIYVLESPWLGNATYVFKDDWVTLSAFTKKQILDGSLHEARLIHNEKWQGALRATISGVK